MAGRPEMASEAIDGWVTSRGDPVSERQGYIVAVSLRDTVTSASHLIPKMRNSSGIGLANQVNVLPDR